MLNHGRYIAKPNQYRNVKLTLNFQLFQEYEVAFPQSSAIKILVADASDWISDMDQGEFNLKDSCLIIEEIVDFWRWICSLAVKKKIGQVGSGESLKNQVLQHFDGLYWTQNQRYFGIHAVQKSFKLSQFPLQITQDLAFLSYRFLLEEYHILNIIFDRIEPDCCRWTHARKQPMLRLGQHWRTAEYQQGHRYWLQMKEDPYTLGFCHLRGAIAAVYAQVKRNKQLMEQLEIQKLVRARKMLFAARHQTFKELKDIYKQTFQKTFAFEDNESFISKLSQYYALSGDTTKLVQLLEQARNQYHSQVIASPKNHKMQKLSKILLQLKYWKFRIQYFQNCASSSAFQEIRRAITLDDPLFIEKAVLCIGKKQSLEKVAKMIPKSSKEGRLRWHFLHSKIQWKSGNFYRSLAHLRQARKQTEQLKFLHIISFQQARNWEQLGFADKALFCYNQSKVWGEEVYGCWHYILLPNLYNLKLLYFKRGILEQGDKIQQQIKKIKQITASYKNKKTTEMPFFKLCKLVEHYCKNYVVLDENQRIQKQLSKNQALKLQAERIPYLQTLRKCYKSVLALEQFQHQKTPSISQIQQRIQLGDTKDSVYLLKLLGELLEHQLYKLTSEEASDILQRTRNMQSTNLKNYHRFLFLLSFYFQGREISLATKCMQDILNHQNIYTKTVRYSLIQRLAHLYKIQNKIDQTIKVFSTQNILLSADVESIFYWITLCSQKKRHSDVIKLGVCYLKWIKSYEANYVGQTQQDRTLLVKFEMIRSYCELRCFDQLARLIEEVGRYDKQEIKKLVFGVFVAICKQLYELRQFQLCYNLLQKIVRNWLNYQQDHKPIQNQQNLLKQIYAIFLGIQSKGQYRLSTIYENWLKSKATQLLLISEDSNDNRLQILEQHTQRLQVFSVSISSIFSLLSGLIKHQNPNFQHLFSLFSNFLGQRDLFLQVQSQIIAQVNKVAKRLGIKSQTAYILHILLLNLSEKNGCKIVQMHFLFWLQPFKFNFSLPQHLTSYFMTKEGRDLRLNKLLYHYFQNQIMENGSVQRLGKLCWFQQKSEELTSLKAEYQSIFVQPLGEADEKLQLKILNFKIKYCSFFDTSLEESEVLQKLYQIGMQLDCPDEEV